MVGLAPADPGGVDGVTEAGEVLLAGAEIAGLLLGSTVVED